MASASIPVAVEKFFRGRKKNPERYIFSEDGSAMISKDLKGVTSTLPFSKYTLKTKEQIEAYYEERAERILELQEQFDAAVRALLDAKERGASDSELIALNKECQLLDSRLFELNWAEKMMDLPRESVEIRQLEFENPYLVKKIETPVNVFKGRHVPIDYAFIYEEGGAAIYPSGEAATAATGVTSAIPIAILQTAAESAAATETRRLEGEEPIEFFFKLENPYKAFSPSYSSAFSLDGKVWPTVTHFFQAQKFPSDPLYQEIIRTSKKPEEATKLGKTIDRPVRPDFELYMDDIMRRAFEAKFDQNPPLKQLLLDSGNRTLLHVNPTDTYWGTGKDRKGKNRTGQLLMELRDKLRNKGTEVVTELVTEAAGAAGAEAELVSTALPLLPAQPPAPRPVKLSTRPPPSSRKAAAPGSAAPPPASSM